MYLLTVYGVYLFHTIYFQNAIEYLFPSGLFNKRARPMMKPPEEIYPQRKAAEFDESGRPHHFLFYTQRPNFYKLLYVSSELLFICRLPSFVLFR